MVTTAYLNSDISGFQQGLNKATKLCKNNLKEIQSTAGQFGDLFGGLAPQLGELSGGLGNIAGSIGALTNPLTASIAAAGAAGAAFFEYNKNLSESLRLTTQFLDVDPSQLHGLTAQARAISDVFGQEFKTTLTQVDQIMKQFGVTGKQAMDLLQQGLIAGANETGEFEANLKEFGPALADLGLNGKEAMAVFAHTRSGIFTDKTLDLLKEASVQLRTMSEDSKQALRDIGVDYDGIMSQVANGEISMFSAMQMMVKQINKLPKDSAKAGRAMEALFAATWENTGTAGLEAIANINTGLDEMVSKSGEYGQAQNDLVKATEEWERALMTLFGVQEGGWDTIVMKLKTGVMKYLSSAINHVAKFWNNAKGVRTAFTAVANVLQIIVTIITKINKMIGTVTWGILDALFNLIQGDFAEAKKSIEDAFSGVKNQFRDAVKSIKKDLDDIANADANTRITIVEEVVEEDKEFKTSSITHTENTEKTGGGNENKTGGKTSTKTAKEEVETLKESLQYYEVQLAKVTELAEKGHLLPEDFKTQSTALQEKIKAKKIELGLELDKNDADKELDKLNSKSKELLIKVNVAEAKQQLSSFEMAVNSVRPEPITPEVELDNLKEAMDENDKFITSLEEQIAKYEQLGQTASSTYQELIDKVKELKTEQENLSIEVKKNVEEEENSKKISKNYEDATDSIANLGSAFSSLGSAFESEGLNIAGIIAQAIAQVMLSLGEVMVQAATLGPFGWIAFSTMALAQVAAVVAQIHQLSGYAQGGLVHSGSSVGDYNMIRVNGGEMVLNDTQQHRLWNIINGSKSVNYASESGEIVFTLRGSDIYGALKNFSKVQKKIGKTTGIK